MLSVVSIGGTIDRGTVAETARLSVGAVITKGGGVVGALAGTHCATCGPMLLPPATTPRIACAKAGGDTAKPFTQNASTASSTGVYYARTWFRDQWHAGGRALVPGGVYPCVVDVQGAEASAPQGAMTC